ncbi:MAG: M16 family metallopeptidase [Gammaproteobacteria bacterium]
MRFSMVVGIILLALNGCQVVKNEVPASSNVTDQKVYSYQLGNGMNILVQPDHRSPVVVSQVWYKVGGSYEYDGVTGVSHALEHMMFKGTNKYRAGEFSEIIAANGGSENAFTGKDYTAYHQRIASDRLELCLKLEADRMRNLVLDENEFKKEIEVIKEERRTRTDDNPTALTYERFNAVAFLNSSYHQPIIGWMDDLDAMTIDDLKSWYQTWYAPNNATLVVHGDVQPQQVYQLAKRYFGSIEPSEIAALKPRIEVQQQGERRVTVRAPAKVPYLLMGYKAPVLKTVEDDWEVYALEVLAGVLDGGGSSRLTQQLVRKQGVASQASAGYSLYDRQTTLFLLDAAPRAKSTVQQLEQALIKEIEKIKRQPPAVDELERVKAQVMAHSVYEQDSAFYQAMQLGILETVGLGWQAKQQYLDKIQSVTPEQVQAVARKYLTQDQLTVAILDPLPIDDAKPRAALGGGRHGR